MKVRKRYLVSGWLFLVSAVLSCLIILAANHQPYQYQFFSSLWTSSPVERIQVDDEVQGNSTTYIGAVEGNVNFNLNDLKDLGINTYRIYGGMSRWEPQDDDGRYGWPSIEQIKADPNIINWEAWDQAMTNPPNGSDYWWSGDNVWQGSAQTIFEGLQSLDIHPVLTLRNVDNSDNPDWAAQLNPPRTQADWNEWWEHVFATVYWLNVKHDYRVDEYEIHNEPDNADQGWKGTSRDYFDFVRVSKDAIDYVYQTYLPNRKHHIHAPISSGGSHWPLDALQYIPDLFDSLNIHTYDQDISPYIQRVRQWMKSTRHADSRLWVGEWGSYKNNYNDYLFAVDLIKNMIRASQPGKLHVYGSHVFSLYDWGDNNKHQGLIRFDGKKSLSYYALRFGARALQGGRPVLTSSASSRDITTIATRSDVNDICLLAVNVGGQPLSVDVDLSAFNLDENVSVREFNQQNQDVLAESQSIDSGHVVVSVADHAAVLLSAKEL